jgi:hypothetical protein
LKGKWGFIRGNRGNGHGRDRGGGVGGGGAGVGAIMGVRLSGIFRNFWELFGVLGGKFGGYFFWGRGGKFEFWGFIGDLG